MTLPEAEPAGPQTPAPGPITELDNEFEPRLVVLDIDGTLIDDDLNLQPRTRAAVRAAAQRLPVILATGRMYRSALPWAGELQVTQPLVCYQGALIRELPNGATAGRVIFEEGLDPTVAGRAVEIARAHDWHVQAYQDDELLCEQDRPEAHLYARIAQIPIRYVDDLARIVTNGSTKIVCVCEDRQVVEECVATMEADLGDRVRVTRSMAQFVELVSPRVNKAQSIELLCHRLGLSLSAALAVGDAPNDVEMIAAAGCGVAIWRARPEVLAVADATCAEPERGGVADVLEHFGLAG
ncbi:MAG: Cof-type HAD-IIB family hydrolase [Candidatus Dormibacteraeota bacterium]|uniref:Cof-type HAD-IIB family hydrolase n=1 Tax=Candidatus Amunia macphersoniae TaxID=3127014 RepID=A0A934NH02_9BACT|nr:Cof-type HAD-IIB family hydrolase [Candidatus Dormibacteraeota bacterium]